MNRFGPIDIFVLGVLCSYFLALLILDIKGCL